MQHIVLQANPVLGSLQFWCAHVHEPVTGMACPLCRVDPGRRLPCCVKQTCSRGAAVLARRLYKNCTCTGCWPVPVLLVPWWFAGQPLLRPSLHFWIGEWSDVAATSYYGWPLCLACLAKGGVRWLQVCSFYACLCVLAEVLD